MEAGALTRRPAQEQQHPLAAEYGRQRVPAAQLQHLLAADVKPGRSRKAVYLESDFLKNYCGNPSAPRDLLKKAGYALQPFGTNSEESYAAGEGAVVYDALNPALCEQLCKRVYGLAGAKKTLFITASATVRDTLKKYNPKFEVITLEEAVALSQA